MKQLNVNESVQVDYSTEEISITERPTGVFDLPSDIDLSEVWFWFHARLRALGELDHDDARLTALLTWNEESVGDAVHAARVHANAIEERDEVRQAHMEYLTAEFLARLVLEEQTIPAPELRSA